MLLNDLLKFPNYEDILKEINEEIKNTLDLKSKLNNYIKIYGSKS